MAMTGFFYTFKRPRTAPLMGMMKYDPIGMNIRIPLELHAASYSWFASRWIGFQY
jgi:hypothetical protein